MINGFVLDIVNERNEEITLSFFTNEKIPDGVSVTARNSNYDYSFLLLMAVNDGFIGNGISIDDNRNSRTTIYRDGTPSSYEFYKLLDNTEITIDGLSNYFTLTIPPSSKTIVQLIPSIK